MPPPAPGVESGFFVTLFHHPLPKYSLLSLFTFFFLSCLISVFPLALSTSYASSSFSFSSSPLLRTPSFPRDGCFEFFFLYSVFEKKLLKFGSPIRINRGATKKRVGRIVYAFFNLKEKMKREESEYLGKHNKCVQESVVIETKELNCGNLLKITSFP